jgi:tetratricopeptide (TPR) repeat protein
MIINQQKDAEISKEELERLIAESKIKLEELEKIGKNTPYIQELSTLALLQIESNEFEQAESNLAICLKHFAKQHDRLGKAAVYGLLGALFFKKEDHLSAIKQFENALEIYNELNQLNEQITCLKGIGNSHLKLNQLEKASDIFFKCAALCSDNNDFYNFLDCLGNLILIYEKLEDWEIVFGLYGKSLDAFMELKDNKGIITSYFNLGIIKKNQEDYESALFYFKNGTNIAIDSNYAESIIKGLGYVGECLFYQGKMNESKHQYLRALRLAQKVKSKNAITQIRVLLNSFGLNNSEIEKGLDDLKP